MKPILKIIEEVTRRTEDIHLIVFSLSLSRLAERLAESFPSRKMYLSSSQDVVSFAAGLDLSFGRREAGRRDLNINRQSALEIMVFAQGGETLTELLLSSFETVYPRARLLYVSLDSQLWDLFSGDCGPSTPLGAATLSTPPGPRFKGNQKSPLPWWQAFSLENISYAAQTALSQLEDFESKLAKAKKSGGLRLLNVLTPSPNYWKYPPEESWDLMEAAVASGFWPLFEAEKGKISLNTNIKKPLDFNDFCRRQGRFQHLLKEAGRLTLDKLEKDLESQWETLRNKLKTAAAQRY